VGNSREHFDARVTLEQRKREIELQEDLTDRRLKRKREEVALELLHDLVRERHPEAIEVFLGTYKGK
jgi:hypothetical protein